MFQIETTDQMERDQKWYSKKRLNELAAIMRNLERYLALLNLAKNSKSVQAGYLHREPSGVVAIDQRGFLGNLQETRLYTFAADPVQILYLIAIGDKASQHDDIEYSKEFVSSLSPDVRGW